ncbi:MAG TPA: WcaI family glycosyltransferase [Longilinea sp.]|nr:WcaI family glycosyltransferase [Longilinea sp.]
MRILIVGINFWPEPTGTGKYTGEMAAYLAERGHQVTVITAPPYFPYWKIQPGYKTLRYQVETWQGVKIIRCPLYVPKKVTGAKRLIHLLTFALSTWPVIVWQKARHPDIIFAVAPTLFSAPAAAYAARRLRWRNWLHIQDFELDAALNLGLIARKPAVEKLARGWEARVYRKFATVSTISEAMLKKLNDKGLDDDAIYYLPNWVDTSLIYPLIGENSFRKQLHLNPSDLVVLYSGSIGQKQGIETLVAAAKNLQEQPNLHFVICGEGPGKADLEKLANGIANIHFLPVQSADSLNELLNMADIHVLPQKAGAADVVMPSKLLGMLASGKPVIAACPPGSALSTIVDQVGVVTPPEDADAFAKNIQRLVSDAALRVRKGEQGRKFVADNFNIEKVLGDLEKALTNLLDHKST